MEAGGGGSRKSSKGCHIYSVSYGVEEKNCIFFCLCQKMGSESSNGVFFLQGRGEEESPLSSSGQGKKRERARYSRYTYLTEKLRGGGRKRVSFS